MMHMVLMSNLFFNDSTAAHLCSKLHVGFVTVRENVELLKVSRLSGQGTRNTDCAILIVSEVHAMYNLYFCF